MSNRVDKHNIRKHDKNIGPISIMIGYTVQQKETTQNLINHNKNRAHIVRGVYFALVSHLSDLGAPGQQRLGAQLMFMLPYIIQKTAMRHQLCYQHHLCRHTHGQDADAVRMIDRCHDAGFFQHLLSLTGGVVVELFDGNGDFDSLSFGCPESLDKKRNEGRARMNEIRNESRNWLRNDGMNIQ